jgi:hypothetical protein
MTPFSSSSSGQPEWHRALPTHLHFTNEALIADLEHLRNELGLDDQVFVMVLLQSETAVLRTLREAYRDAQRQLPDRPQQDYFAMVIGDRITKKIMTHDVNTSPTALSKRELEGIIDDLEDIAARCSTFDDVIRFLIDIENRERNFDDRFGLITRVDAICSRYNDPFGPVRRVSAEEIVSRFALAFQMALTTPIPPPEPPTPGIHVSREDPGTSKYNELQGIFFRYRDFISSEGIELSPETLSGFLRIAASGFRQCANQNNYNRVLQDALECCRQMPRRDIALERDIESDFRRMSKTSAELSRDMDKFIKRLRSTSSPRKPFWKFW